MTERNEFVGALGRLNAGDPRGAQDVALLALPWRTSARVFAAMITRPSATATRSVAGFAETSTIRASPRSVR
jgi:hypothetical protein